MYRILMTTLVAVVTATTPVVAEHECSVSDFQGRYGFQGIGFDALNNPVTPLSMAGSIVADGEGKLTYWQDFAHFGLIGGPPFKRLEMNDFVTLAQMAGREATYTVFPDCRMTITIPLPSPAPTLELQGILVDGGRTARMLIGSPRYVGNWTAYKADGSVEETLAYIKKLLQRVAWRQGILPREELDE